MSNGKLSGEHRWCPVWAMKMENKGEYERTLIIDEAVESRSNMYFAHSVGEPTEKYFVKKPSSSHKDAPVLPYCLPEIGKFKVEGDTYCVYIRYEYGLSELFFDDSSELNKIWNRMGDNVQKEKNAASVFLRMMFTIRSLYMRDYSALDVKVFNVVCNIAEKNGEYTLDARMIDIESMHFGSFESADADTDVPVYGSPKWQPPVFFVMSSDKADEEVHRAMKCGDVYSMGILLYWLYTQGETIWAEPWSGNEIWSVETVKAAFVEKNREKYNAMYGGNEEWQDPVRAFRANYRRFYYRYIGSDDNRSQMIKEIKGSDFTFAADGNRIAELIKDMLSYPDKRRYENNVAFCEKVISEYCCILAENDCLPDMEIPGRYLPHTCRGNDTVQMVVQLCTQMCCRDGYKSEWNEYRAFRLKDGDVQNVPLVFCRTDPGSFPFREIAENMLFLTVRDGKIFYRVMLDENGLADGGRLVLLGSDGAPCFGELTADSKLSFCVREKIDGTQVETHKITLSVAVPQQKTTDHAPEERLIWGLT